MKAGKKLFNLCIFKGIRETMAELRRVQNDTRFRRQKNAETPQLRAIIAGASFELSTSGFHRDVGKDLDLLPVKYESKGPRDDGATGWERRPCIDVKSAA